jgi:FolB domain-containing protein
MSGEGTPGRDRIEITDLLLRGIVGIKPEERVKPQDILINLVLVADCRPAGASDDIADAVNYRTVTKEIIALVEASSFHTVEKLATGALRFARSVGVTITRRREDFPAS